jgi:preprotein translocase subunit SecE
MGKILEFFTSVRKEMKKVSWPEQSELKDNTVVVVVFSILLSAFIFLVDKAYSAVLEALYQ